MSEDAKKAAHTDRELLELAARAAGIELTEFGSKLIAWRHLPGVECREWNPLTDDGDAFRLGVKLGLFSDVPVWGTTNYAEFRRAIVRAAAALASAEPAPNLERAVNARRELREVTR